ncbi:hypothetical protein [Prauserella cavernicola]|uniref:Uncharacterized protein n=1 Tax=Prauserella cavernicola TaxID=2800127 RepID=A0A934QN97_9PSEU|nr:hypothetical protein [Prauserella cavernicola]MBK1783756.1 hypothetical protein [Prauserella cavernicola]
MTSTVSELPPAPGRPGPARDALAALRGLPGDQRDLLTAALQGRSVEDIHADTGLAREVIHRMLLDALRAAGGHREPPQALSG